MANDFAVVSSVNTRFLLGPCIGVFELIANLRKRQYTRSVRMLPADSQHAVASGRDTRNEEVNEMTTDTQVTWLTQEAYDRLKAELDQLIANRPVIAAEINDRREEGDLRENGGYHAAPGEQGQQGARLPPRPPPRGRQRRQARGLLAELPARRRADRREGRRDPDLHVAQRQRRKGDPGQRRALPLVTERRQLKRLKSAHGADSRGPATAAARHRGQPARTRQRPPGEGARRRSALGLGLGLQDPPVGGR